MDRIGRTIGRIRKRTGMSQQELADRIGSTRNAVQNLESPRGRRSSLNVLDLVEIAAALDIPPILLLYPDYPDGRVEAIPGVESTSEDAARWFAGEQSLPSPDGGTYREDSDGRRVFVIAPVNDGVRLVDKVRKRRELPRVGESALRAFSTSGDLSEEERQGIREELHRLHGERALLDEEIARLHEKAIGDGG